jgi:DNA mismatch repair protein MutS
VGVLDVTCTFAKLAHRDNLVEPEISQENFPQFQVQENWHPVLKQYLESSGGFVPNSVFMGSNARILLITGPNMAGKSTIMRQTAVTQLMFQLGGFVPATSAKLSVCDKIFTRIGSGQSTFLVEMMESANILKNATHRSMVIMDEIGRGTSTFDGIALAQAILERLHDSQIGRVLFSTHYHELAEVSQTRSSINCFQMEVLEISDTEIVFTRRFVPGAGGKSYGLHVAKLAGIPLEVVARAGEILSSKMGVQNALRAGKVAKKVELASECLF